MASRPDWQPRRTRRGRRVESGQALVVGAFALLLVALGTMSTVQLGHAIHERMRLQDAADNAAYSTAVVVARSLNGIAWLNRAMIAQYVSAMSAQSMVAALDGYHALVGLSADLLQTMAAGACATRGAAEACCATGAGAPLCCPTAASLGALEPGLADGAEALRRAADGIAEVAARLDPAAARFVRAVSDMNLNGLYAAQVLLRDATSAALAAPSESFAARVLADTAGAVNDGAAGRRYLAAMASYNAASYARLFNRAGSERLPQKGGTAGPYDDGKAVQNAEKIMAELVNASRTRWESGHGLGGSGAAELGAAGAARAALNFDLLGASRLVDAMPPVVFSEGATDWGALASPGGDVIGGDDYGVDAVGSAPLNNYVFMNYTYHSEFTRGAALASPEFVRAGFSLPPLQGGRAPRVVGVQSAWKQEARFHCRYAGRDLKALVPGCPPFARTRPETCTREPQHEFWGITRYLSLAVDEDPAQAFARPDFLVLAHKSAAAAGFPANLGMGFGGAPLRVTAAGATATFDPGRARSGFDGMHAWARAVAYYHRPGGWAEPPNLFNPYWRARLAPTRLRLEALRAAAGSAVGADEARVLDLGLVH